MENFKFKENYGIDDLLRIMEILRGPGGCPWDAEQNHESIKKSFIEETYEVIEAINKKDKDLLQEELGDVLLQVMFQCVMAEQEGRFTFDDVANAVSGFQVGLINRSESLYGVQVGAVNVIRSAEPSFLPIVNVGFEYFGTPAF